MLLHITRAARQALLVVLALGLALPTVALAADRLDVKTDSTFRLLPGKDRVRVTIDIRMTNRHAPTYTVEPCRPGSSQRCRFKHSYYFDQWGYVYVPAGATGIRFSGGVGKRLDEQTQHWKRFSVSFPDLYYGRTRSFRVTYSLPGGEPRSKHRTRVMDAYSYFCWHGEPGDRGTVVAKLPPGYQATTYGEKTRIKRNRKGTTIIARFKASPGTFYACTDAFKPRKLLRTELTSPGGQHVTIEGWPEDPEWSEAMVNAVETTLPDLEALIGEPMPLDEIVVREVSRQSLYGYGSSFRVRHALMRLGEHIDEPTMAPRGLALTWFNERRIKDEWLQMGLSDWAGYRVSGYRCGYAGAYPGKGKPNLRKWKHYSGKPTERQEALIDWQYDAACGLVEDVADRIGDGRMREVIAALVDRRPAYGTVAGDSTRKRSGKRTPATWHDWLDAVDEIGLVPAGVSDLTMAEEALRAHGIATRKQLKGRAEARLAYHETLASMAGTPMPGCVDRAMNAWDFEAARKAIAVAANTYDEIVGCAAMDHADRQSFLERFSAAGKLKSLRALKREAESFRRIEPIVPLVDDGPDLAIMR